MLLLVNLVLVIDTYREEPKCLSQYAEKKEIEFPLIKILLRAGAPAKYFAALPLPQVALCRLRQPDGLTVRLRSFSTQEEVFDIGLVPSITE